LVLQAVTAGTYPPSMLDRAEQPHAHVSPE
jgi:hypothetical protein